MTQGVVINSGSVLKIMCRQDRNAWDKMVRLENLGGSSGLKTLCGCEDPKGEKALV